MPNGRKIKYKYYNLHAKVISHNHPRRPIAAMLLLTAALALHGLVPPTPRAPGRPASVEPLGRRAVLGLAAAAAGLRATRVSAEEGVQRGAEDPYKMQMFGDTVCVRRTPLGACAEVGTPKAAAEAPLKTLSAPAGAPSYDGLPDTDYIQSLRQRTAENAEANARDVQERTVRAGLAGSYGPLASTAPVMTQDGGFVDVALGEYDALKNAGKLQTTKTGLDQFVEGYDPSRPLREQQEGGWFFGLF